MSLPKQPPRRTGDIENTRLFVALNDLRLACLTLSLLGCRIIDCRPRNAKRPVTVVEIMPPPRRAQLRGGTHKTTATQITYVAPFNHNTQVRWTTRRNA